MPTHTVRLHRVLRALAKCIYRACRQAADGAGGAQAREDCAARLPEASGALDSSCMASS